MNYCRLKLKFSSPVHFGSGEHAQSLTDAEMTCCADTLFSTLCFAALNRGRSQLEEMLNCARAGDFLLSDLFPYRGDDLYLPRPVMLPDKRIEGDPTKRKKAKKLKYLTVTELIDYTSCMRRGEPFEADVPVFGVRGYSDKAAVYTGGDALPYTVGSFSYAPGCGLYAILAYSDDGVLKKIISLFESAGCSGIGGKISSGYGKFSVESVSVLSEASKDHAEVELFKSITDSSAPRQMLLTTALPKNAELPDAIREASYSLRRRGGFIGACHGTESRKAVQYFFSAGSIFAARFEGDIYNVGSDTNPAFRYARPLFMAVK